MAIVANSVTLLQDIAERWHEGMNGNGMKINTGPGKIEFMVVSRREHDCQLSMGRQQINKTVLVEFLRLGPGESLCGLVEVFQKHLREFCTRVLRAALPKVGANIPIPKDINMKELTAVLAQVQTLWREGDSPKLGDDDVRRVCSVLVSAEYCEEMTGRLESKLKERSPVSLANTISLAQEQDLFHAVLAQCIALLVTHVECLCEPALTSMVKMNWMMEQTGDQSPYVTAIAQHISSSVPLVRHNLHTSRKYFTRFCDKLAAAIVNKFVQQLYKCRPISGVGCEQLLLDCHALKAVMLQLPVVNSQVRRDPPQAYTRMVGRGMARAELVLQKQRLTTCPMFAIVGDKLVEGQGDCCHPILK
ncbi:Vacuolar protein sorting-associated protein 53 [Halocaridina rubra]|uniref:Vacuolar protein sorting-associated protein 53 n=1 Tax=Halocaridina rubra TaxID=373956 RepID=A0AAN8XG19_HALRR